MFALDASIVFAVFFADENSEYAQSVVSSLSTIVAVVPVVWHVEVPNLMIVGERRGRCTSDQSESFLAYLTMLPISTEPIPSLDRTYAVVSLARKHGLTAYDASYLELALRLNIPLASLDKPLVAAARAEGVPI